jgi:hypothetical protein
MKINNIHIPNMLGIGIPFLSWMPGFIRKKVETAKIYIHKKNFSTFSVRRGFQTLKWTT